MAPPLVVPHKDVRELLEQGYTYAETANQLNISPSTVKGRNHEYYQIDLHAAFRERVERDGLPDRLTADPDFCRWFSGFFDGEGCLTAIISTDGRRHAGATIGQRFDDLALLEQIQRELGIGAINRNKQKGSPSKLKFYWVVSNVKDSVEVLIPLFDRYPLRSKKGKEYFFWRQYVLNMYVATLGGESARALTSMPDRESFDKLQELLAGEISKIRHPIPDDNYE